VVGKEITGLPRRINRRIQTDGGGGGDVAAGIPVDWIEESSRNIVSPRTTRGLGRRRRRHVGSQKLFKVFPFIALLYRTIRRRRLAARTNPPAGHACKPNSRVSNGRRGKKIYIYPSVISNHITTTAPTVAAGYFAGILRRRVCNGEAVRCCRRAACVGPESKLRGISISHP